MRKQNKNTVKKSLIGAGLGLSLMFSGCSAESESLLPETDITSEAVRNLGSVTFVQPGESRFVKNVDQNSKLAKKLIEHLPLVDHIYPNGVKDETAPEIVETPQRIRTIVSLGGSKSNYLNQDSSCDTLRIGGDLDEIRSIGVVALGGEELSTFVNWPLDENGEVAEYLYLCNFQEVEPEDGAIVFTQTEAL